MFHFYVLTFIKKWDTIQGGTLFKEIGMYVHCAQSLFVMTDMILCTGLLKTGRGGGPSFYVVARSG